MAEEKGVWRTIRGRRVFIREGEDLYTAMKNSGKFEKLGRSEYQQAKAEYTKQNNNVAISSMKHNKMNKEKSVFNDLEINSIGTYGSGTYVQFQDSKKNIHEDIKKYPNVSPKVASNTWARVWEDKENTLNIEDSKYGARKQVLDYLRKKNASANEKLDAYNNQDYYSALQVKEQNDLVGKHIKNDSDESKYNNWIKEIKKQNFEETYEQAIDRIDKIQGFDERKQAITDYVNKTGASRETINDALAEKEYDRQLGKEYEKRFGKKSYDVKEYAKWLSKSYMAGEEYNDKTTPRYIQDIEAGRYGNMTDEDAIKNWIDGGADIVYIQDAENLLKQWGVPVRNDDAFGTYKEELTKQLLPIYKEDKLKNRNTGMTKQKEQVPSMTKSGKLNFKGYGIERTPEGDFSDDGNRFKSYMLNNGMEMTYLKDNGDTYISVRNPYNKEISYEEYSKLPHYRDLDMYNGVSNTSHIDLGKLVDSANAYMSEYNELLKKKGLPIDTRDINSRRIDNINFNIENAEASYKYHNENQDYTRWRYHRNEANKAYKRKIKYENQKEDLIATIEGFKRRKGK